MPNRPRLSPDRLRLVLVTDRLAAPRPLDEVVADAVEGGVTAVLLREKDLSARDLHALGRRLLPVVRERGAAFLVADRVDVALALGADGAHLGWTSLEPRAARHAAGDRLALGLSTHEPAEVAEAFGGGCDYVFFGPVRETPSKEGLVAPRGIEGLQRAVAAAAGRGPVVAIGGATPECAAALLNAGAEGVAAIRALVADPEPRRAASAFRAAMGGPPTGRPIL